MATKHICDLHHDEGEVPAVIHLEATPIGGWSLREAKALDICADDWGDLFLRMRLQKEED